MYSRTRSQGPRAALLPAVLASCLAGVAGCGDEASPPSTEAVAEAAASAEPTAGTTTPAKPKSAYAGLDLGFPGCDDGGCPEVPDSTFIPTPADIVEQMLALAKVGAADVLYDLGSGDGRVLLASARLYGNRCVGVELNPSLAESSRARVAEEGLSDRIEIRSGDMFEVDLSGVDVLVLYQPPKLLERMKPQLYSLPAGARIVSHQFLIPGIPPEKTLVLSSNATHFEHQVHLWRAPLLRTETSAATP